MLDEERYDNQNSKCIQILSLSLWIKDPKRLIMSDKEQDVNDEARIEWVDKPHYVLVDEFAGAISSVVIVIHESEGHFKLIFELFSVLIKA